MSFGNPFGWVQLGMFPGYAPMTPAMPDQLAQLRGAQPYPPPMPQQTAQQPQQGGGLIWVQGEAGAKSFLVAPGQSVLLMDSERSSFYLKSADASGVPGMRTFDYTERTAQAAPAQSAEQYATRAEVDELKAQLAAMMQQTQRASRRVKEDTHDEQPAL